MQLVDAAELRRRKRKQENKDISLIIVNAFSTFIDEDRDVALPNIQSLIDSGITSDIYEFFESSSDLKHNGERIKMESAHDYENCLKICDITDRIILVGGSFGNEHYTAFAFLLKQARESGLIPSIHMPFDCIHAFRERYDSGESWIEGILADPEMPVFDLYKKALQKNALGVYAIEIDGKFAEKSPITTLRLWKEQKTMIDYLANNIAL